MGYLAGSSGTVTVNDSTWVNNNTLYVGYEGSGELNILMAQRQQQLGHSGVSGNGVGR